MTKITKVTVHAGHNKPGKIACGASDYLDESTEARIICRKVIRLLKKHRITAYNCTVNNGTCQYDVLKKICKKCNAKERQLDISIHFNACSHSKADGRTNRGVKTESNLYFLNHTNRPAILIEVCFVDDQDDAKLYKQNKDAVAQAIVKAVLNYNKSCR